MHAHSSSVCLMGFTRLCRRQVFLQVVSHVFGRPVRPRRTRPCQCTQAPNNSHGLCRDAEILAKPGCEAVVLSPHRSGHENFSCRLRCDGAHTCRRQRLQTRDSTYFAKRHVNTVPIHIVRGINFARLCKRCQAEPILKTSFFRRIRPALHLVFNAGSFHCHSAADLARLHVLNDSARHESGHAVRTFNRCFRHFRG